MKKTAYLVSIEKLLAWLERIGRTSDLIGPVTRRRETVFEKVEDVGRLDLGYKTTMASPRRFIYPPRQTIFKASGAQAPLQAGRADKKRIIVGIHPCDMHAISILDRTLLEDGGDWLYRRSRKSAITIVLNCNRACDRPYPSFTLRAFCASMGAGPHLRLTEGFDIELTAFPTDDADPGSPPGAYLVQAGSRRGSALLQSAKNLRPAAEGDFVKKHQFERQAAASLTKSFDTSGLPELLARNLGHPAYRAAADSRCLNCTNCTMVCPTCYCYDIEDETGMDLERCERRRQWDSCLELGFAKVHGTNFRPSREARLRQFVTHKLCNWVDQYGCFGCVGCGRCMTWCPTNIDLTSIAEEIRSDQKKSGQDEK